MTNMKGSDVSRAASIAVSAITPETDSVRITIEITNADFDASRAVQALLLFLTNLLIGAKQPVVGIQLESYPSPSESPVKLWPPGSSVVGSIPFSYVTGLNPESGEKDESSKYNHSDRLADMEEYETRLHPEARYKDESSKCKDTCNCWECGGPGWE
jgi:hypothetical protein